MNFAKYYYLNEGLKSKLKALGLAGLAALSNPAKSDDMTVSFNIPANKSEVSQPKSTNSNNVAEIDIVAATIFKEARGEGQKGMQAVNEVINNRSRVQKKSKSSICLQPKQFSCWNGIKPTKAVIDRLQKSDPTSFALAKKIALEKDTNHTRGAQYYHTHKVSPKWGKNLLKRGYKTISIGNHLFYYEP